METLGYVMIGNKTPLIQKVNYLNFVYKKKVDPVYLYTFARRFKIYTRVQ